MARVKNKINLRNQLGVSQDHFALWLGISKNQVVMHETNQNSLPSSAKKKLSEINKTWLNFQANWEAKGKNLEVMPPSKSILRKINTLQNKKLQAETELRKLDEQPDFAKTIEFFKLCRKESKDELEKLIFRRQIENQEKERRRTEKKKKALKTDLELINRQLEVLEKKPE